MMDLVAPFLATYRLEYVDRLTGNEIGGVAGVLRGGTLSRNMNTSAKESASVTLVGDFTTDSRLVRLYADLTQDGETESVALGTFVPSISGDSYDGTAHKLTIQLDGRLTELANDMPDAPIVYEAGTPAVYAAQQIAEQCGFEVLAESSTYTTSSVRTYGLDDGDTKLSIINDLLDLAGFSSASCDEYGRILLTRYVQPKDRDIAATMVEGSQSRFMRSATIKRDESAVANVVQTVYSTQDETVIGTAVDKDPTSPYSTISRGRRIVARYTYSDIVSQEVADNKAAELLETNQAITTKINIEYIWQPITLEDVVELKYPSAGIDGCYAIRTQDISLTAGMPVQCEMRSFAR